MKIEAVDFFYLSLPVVRDMGDGSQDALLVRVRAGQETGWSECEAAPLVCMASWNCPMSHSACKPLSASVLGQKLDGPDDIERINSLVRAQSMDLLQTDHTLSGIDIALWDLLARSRGEPVWRTLGFKRTYPKVAYASQLFGDDPQITYRQACAVAQAGFQAAKFGWGPFGRGTIEADIAQVEAAREGLGPEAMLLVDAGTVWGDDVAAAVARLPMLEANRVIWLEEPFVSGALEAYRQCAEQCRSVAVAGGEGCHTYHQAKQMIDHAQVGFIQIDAGRIGGITTARQVARYASERGVKYVNHTFTTDLALSASVQAYAGQETDTLCEFPFDPSALARDFTQNKMVANARGQVTIPDRPGLGVEPDLEALRKYFVPVELKVGGETVFRSLELK